MLHDTNPVQQKIEYLTDSWNEIPKNKYKIIRTLIKSGDEKMIDAFYSYMLGVGVPISDIAINISCAFNNMETYSEEVIKEIEALVNLWNVADFSKTEIDKVVIDWKKVINNQKDNNVAQLFVENMNSLVQTLNLQKGRFLIINLMFSYSSNNKELNKWLTHYLSTNIDPQLKLMITDTKGDESSESISDSYSDQVYIWEPNIDTPNVINQVAAMGDPQDPGTAYRLSFAKLLKAITENNSKKTQKEAVTCLEIACNNVEKDPYWLLQIVTVNIVLSNDYFKNNLHKEALNAATQAIKIGETAPLVIGENAGCSILAQAQTNKATMLCLTKEWEEGSALFELAAESFIKSNMHIGALESYRMAAYCAAKNGNKELALDNLVKGYRISDKIDLKILRGGTFSLFLLQLTKMNHEERIPFEELNIRATFIFGEDWQETIRQSWAEIDLEAIYKDDPFLTQEQVLS